MSEVLCSICNAPMYLQKRLLNTKKKATPHGYKKFRYECIICDRTELRFTSNKICESPLFDMATDKAIKKMHKEQEKNNRP